MTKATKETVNREVVTYVPETVVTLTLTEEEAKVLVAVLGSVLGSPTGTRGVTDDIYSALREIYSFDDIVEYTDKIQSEIRFND